MQKVYDETRYYGPQDDGRNPVTQDQLSLISDKKYSTVVIGTEDAGYTALDVDFLVPSSGDAGPVINEAIESISNSSSGGEVKLLNGTYLIKTKSPIRLTNKITLTGCGSSTIIQREANGDDREVCLIPESLYDDTTNTLTLTTLTSGASIYYSIGEENIPSHDSTLYSGPFVVPGEIGNLVWVNYIAIKDGAIDSEIGFSYCMISNPPSSGR